MHVEDVVGGPHLIEAGARVWFRQVNPENRGVKIRNAGGEVWILGLKTEKEGTVIETTDGGTTELLGGLVYPVGALPLEQPMFTVRDATFGAIVGESSYSSSSNHCVVVEETRGSEVRRLHDDELPGRTGFGRGAQLDYFTTLAPAEPPTAPVLHYRLDEGAGSVVTDGSGAGNDGLVAGAAAWPSDGIAGGGPRLRR